VIGRSELSATEGFRTRGERWKNREEIDRIMNEWTRQHTKAQVFEAMIAADVPCGIVQDVAEVLEDADLNERGVFGEIDHPGLGHLKLPRSPIVFGDERAEVEPSPFLGQHNASLYKELLGYDQAKLAQLAEEGVVTGPEPVEGPAS
jgi:formyl-CoA transferase